MPRWNDGLVDAFPVPLDHQLSRLSLTDKGLQAPNVVAKDIEEAREADAVAAAEILVDPHPFRFFALPAEIRNRIYNLVLFSKPLYRLASGKRRGSRIAILLASKRFHQEASYSLYSTTKFLIFPVQEFNALPTIDELPLKYRLVVANVAMVVGPSWTDPPKSWRVTKSLRRCLKNLQNVQTVSVFVEFDPSHPAFRRFRISENFYTDFCGELLEDVLDAMPQAEYVQFDGNPGVDVHGPLVSRLRNEAVEQDKKVSWGREAGWAHSWDRALPMLQSPSSSSLVLTVPADSRSSIRATKAKATRNGGRPQALQHKVLERVRDT